MNVMLPIAAINAFERNLSYEKSLELIDNVGKALAEKILATWGPHSALLLVGPGHNGADALAAGFYLRRAGVYAKALVHGIENAAAREFKARFLRAGGLLTSLVETAKFDLVLDGLFGTNYDPFRTSSLLTSGFLSAINQSSTIRVAIDISSGVSAETGEINPQIGAFAAHYTFNIGTYKAGSFLNQGLHHAGEVGFIDLGLSPSFQNHPEAIHVLDKGHLNTSLKRDLHKYTKGALQIIAGSSAYPGAAHLACLGAQSVGTGIIFLNPHTTVAIPEIVRGCSDKVRAIVIGSGLGRNEAAKALFTEWHQNTMPVVIDGDGIFLSKTVPARNHPTIWTPHRQELFYLLGISPDAPLSKTLLYEIQAKITPSHIFVIKGAPTFIVTKDKIVLIPNGSPILASAGTGDVLAGMIGGLLARGLDPLEAASLGASLHAEASRSFAHDLGFKASDLATKVSRFFQP